MFCWICWSTVHLMLCRTGRLRCHRDLSSLQQFDGNTIAAQLVHSRTFSRSIIFGNLPFFAVEWKKTLSSFRHPMEDDFAVLLKNNSFDPVFCNTKWSWNEYNFFSSWNRKRWIYWRRFKNNVASGTQRRKDNMSARVWVWFLQHISSCLWLFISCTSCSWFVTTWPIK